MIVAAKYLDADPGVFEEEDKGEGRGDEEVEAPPAADEKENE